jgi:hypothetical protein
MKASGIGMSTLKLGNLQNHIESVTKDDMASPKSFRGGTARSGHKSDRKMSATPFGFTSSKDD